MKHMNNTPVYRMASGFEAHDMASLDAASQSADHLFWRMPQRMGQWAFSAAFAVISVLTVLRFLA